VGRTAQAVAELQAQFKARTVQKFYLALVYGRPASPSGLIDVPIGRHPQHRKRMAPLAAGKSAQTVYQLLESFEAFSLLKVELKTGRTHQIRVHLDWLGHPVVGDRMYGRRKPVEGLSRQFLHASELSIRHPVANQSMNFQAPLPAELQAFLAASR
jgi:23S rRNA pseudouridine1911/1915/1917 synthase